MGFVVAIVVLMFGPPPSAVPEVESVGFGTGFGTGASCVLAGVASTFPAGVTVMMAATFSPVPSSVTITTYRDAVLVQGPAAIKPDALGCVNGRLPNLEAGHYKVVITVPASEMPPLTGEFDVTP